MTSSQAADARREHRLAVVLYGGVSLCIYMHGTTKEINRLVSASAALAAGTHDAHDPSEAVYRDLLRWKAEDEGFRTDVVVDVIAGTSAGGINGVYLAKALAENRSQDRLREMWLDQADLKLLLRGPKWLPVPLRAPWVLARLKSTPALHGETMSRLLYEALVSMDEAPTPSAGSLVPPGSTLDLLVTTTDFYGYNREVQIWDPKSVHDEQHRHVFHFTATDAGGLGSAESLALAFAARATSCFPGAFEPVNRPSFTQTVGARGAIPDSLFRSYELANADPDKTFFVDGGVLDNRPFSPAIEAIRGKPAEVEVERTLIYLDPDPAPPLPRAEGKLPDVLQTVAGAIAGLPRKQPILDSLLEVQRMNTHVAALQEVIRASFQEVAAEVLRTVSEPPGTAHPQLADDERRLHVAARERVQIGYPTYMRLRIGAMLNHLATVSSVVCDYPSDSTHAMLVLAAWQEWGAQTELLGQSLAAEGEPQLLRAIDVEFSRRRFHFTLAGVNWIYEHNPQMSQDERRRIDAVKQRLWGATLELSGATDEVVRGLAPTLQAAFPEEAMRVFLNEHGFEPGEWLERKRADFDLLVGALTEGLGPVLQDIASRLYLDLLDLTASWSGDQRDGVLMRYVGFPLWDAQLLPLERLADGGERDAVKVMRTSPKDATLLTASADEPKLKGTALLHFGAFTQRAWRENDYLIGRLDGSERLIRMLVADEPTRVAWTKQAFLAILAEEEQVLKTAASLIATLRQRAEALPAPAAPGLSVGEKKNERHPGPTS
jgi:patatin-related protein